jgi:hypothetical protein
MNHEKTSLLAVAFAMQILFISSPLFTYKFGAGLPCFLVIGLPEPAGRAGLYFGFDADWGAAWRFGFAEDRPWRIGVKVVAAALFALLRRPVAQAEAAAQGGLKTRQSAGVERRGD